MNSDILLPNKTASSSRLIAFFFHFTPSFRHCKTVRSHSQERESRVGVWLFCGGGGRKRGGGHRWEICEWDSWARGQRQRAQAGSYLDEGLHIAVKQLTVKYGARSTLPHSLGFRGKSGGPGDMVRLAWDGAKTVIMHSLRHLNTTLDVAFSVTKAASSPNVQNGVAYSIGCCHTLGCSTATSTDIILLVMNRIYTQKNPQNICSLSAHYMSYTTDICSLTLAFINRDEQSYSSG